MGMFELETRRKWLKKHAGVSLSKDGKSILTYNPGMYHANYNFLKALPMLPNSVTKEHYQQIVLLLVVMHFYVWVLSDGTQEGQGEFDKAIIWCYNNIRALAVYILGLFVSLVLAKTYYANRGCFGTVFGCSMGLAQMTVGFVNPPKGQENNPAAIQSTKDSRKLMIRYINAGFRLMYLETLPISSDEVGKDIIEQDLLTAEEWAKLKPLSSKCTHIYQWITNVLHELFVKGYITSAPILSQMSTQVDLMRGANVWGLPSLPIAYTQLITHMVKLFLFTLACAEGARCAFHFKTGLDGEFTSTEIYTIGICHMDLVISCYLYQGLLDLHGHLYHPNSGTKIGHLPSLNFMDFVRDVTEHLDTENDSLPYSLALVDQNGTVSTIGKRNQAPNRDGSKSLWRQSDL